MQHEDLPEPAQELEILPSIGTDETAVHGEDLGDVAGGRGPNAGLGRALLAKTRRKREHRDLLAERVADADEELEGGEIQRVLHDAHRARRALALAHGLEEPPPHAAALVRGSDRRRPDRNGGPAATVEDRAHDALLLGRDQRAL